MELLTVADMVIVLCSCGLESENDGFETVRYGPVTVMFEVKED